MNMKKRKKLKKIRSYIVRYAIIITWSIIAILPIYVAVMTSLTPFEKLGEKMLIPKYAYWQNYVDLATQTPM